MTEEGVPPTKRMRQAKLSEVMGFHGYGIVFTFADEVFGSHVVDGCPIEEIWRDSFADYLVTKGFENVRCAIEYGEKGRPHLDCTVTRKKPMRLDHVKRLVMQSTGMNREQLSQLSDYTKKYWICVKELPNIAALENRFNYGLKEKKAASVRGELFTPTWIQEAIANAEKRKALVKCKSANLKFVNDMNFAESVMEYSQKLPEESRTDDLNLLIPWMARDGYKFYRVRNLKLAKCEYYALVCGDTSFMASYCKLYDTMPE